MADKTINREEFLKRLSDKSKIFTDKARAKNFHDDIIAMSLILAGSKEGHAVYKDTATGIDKLIEIIDECNDGQKFFDRVLEEFRIND